MTSEELKAMQSRSPAHKVNVTDTKILEFCIRTNWKIAVAYSGGKDSGILLERVAVMWAAHKEQHGNSPLVAVFANTGNEFAGMATFARCFCEYIAKKHNISVAFNQVHGETADSDGKAKGDSLRRVVQEEGYPIGSKMTARKVRDIRAWLKKSGIKWNDIQNRLDNKIESADYIRSLGASDTVVLYLTGVSSKNEYNRKSMLAVCWRPLVIADFETSEICCNRLKKAPMKAIQRELGLNPIIGEMASNSNSRREAYLKTGCNAYKGMKGVSKPLGPWLEQDILWYYNNYKLPFFERYGELVERDGRFEFTEEQNTGCKLCLFGIRMGRGGERIERLHRTEPQAVKKALLPIDQGGLNYLHVINYINKNCGCKVKIPQETYDFPHTERGE